jgi:3-hydroxymyristoyl/3-hydroxydecanoyl-(acyl carrier protein) dehydratase
MAPASALQQVLSSLPHGPEFRFVDEITSLTPGIEGTARWTLKGSEDFLRGHFPGLPILPGVLMVEALAQLAGVIVQSARADHPLKDLRLTAIRQFKVTGTISPGESLRIQARIDGALGGLIQASGSLTTESGHVIGTGGIVLSGVE